MSRTPASSEHREPTPSADTGSSVVGSGKRFDADAWDPADGDSGIRRFLLLAQEWFGLDITFVAEISASERILVSLGNGADAAVIEVAVRERDGHDERGGAPPVRASTPITLADGRRYGVLRCDGTRDDTERRDRRERALHMVARSVAEHLNSPERAHELDHRRDDDIGQLLRQPGLLQLSFQPVVDLGSGHPVAFEALARFPHLGTPPDEVFAWAWAIGYGAELEVLALQNALGALERIPAQCKLSVNVSPATIITQRFAEAVRDVPPGALVVEVTEHQPVDDYADLALACRRLRRRGVSVWVDDVGAGFAGLNHILQLEPDGIKIDRSLITDAHNSAAKQAMIAALTGFSDATRIDVIAEGIELVEELHAAQALGVGYGQGYLLGRPAPSPRSGREPT